VPEEEILSEAANVAPVSPGWRRWVAVSLLRGTPLAKVISTMVAEGIDEADAARLCASVFIDPVFEAAEWANGQLKKLESVLAMRQQMRALAPEPAEVERRAGVGREEFLADYYAANRPVLLEDVCDDWRALERWTPEYLTQILGHQEVEVMAGREADALYERNAGEHRNHMPFDEYVAKILATEWSNDLYLVANNKLLESEVASPLWEDISFDERYLLADERRNRTFLWFGPAGTVTPMHHDIMNILFHQISGSKRFTLVSPLETHCVSNSVGVYSDVDPLAPDLARFPRYARAHPIQVTVNAGETLFVPVGWWHHVLALDLSVSVSTTSFRFPNTVSWSNPKQIL
jgi:ribosomal protein L16 Arg81 hydroxylase